MSSSNTYQDLVVIYKSSFDTVVVFGRAALSQWFPSFLHLQTQEIFDLSQNGRTEQNWTKICLKSLHMLK